MEEEKFAIISWTVDDVIGKAEELGIEISLKDAKRLLENRESLLESAAVEAGWEVIEFALDEYTGKVETR